MHKTNVFALFLFIIFNAIIIIGAGSLIVGTLVAAWASLLSILASPFLIIGAHLFQWQTITLISVVASLLLALLALLVTPLLRRFTHFIKDLIALYWAYTIKIYYR